MLLDGDNVRHGLNRDLGFTDADRVENIRRVGEVARLMVEAGLIVICSFISPFRAERRMVREIGCAERVLRDLRRHAARGMHPARPQGPLRQGARPARSSNFTGIDSPYEPPEAPEIHLSTLGESAENAAERIVDELRRCRII